MILVSTSNSKVQFLTGRDFTSQTVGNRQVCFRVKGTPTNFVSTVLKTYQNGSSYIVETLHSAYEFKLNENERICMGNTILTDSNIEDVVIEQPAKKSFFEKLFK